MTKEQWIILRQKHSEVPWEEMLASGWDAVPCNCKLAGCLGWRLARKEVRNPPPFNDNFPRAA